MLPLQLMRTLRMQSKLLLNDIEIVSVGVKDTGCGMLATGHRVPAYHAFFDIDQFELYPSRCCPDIAVYRIKILCQ